MTTGAVGTVRPKMVSVFFRRGGGVRHLAASLVRGGAAARPPSRTTRCVRWLAESEGAPQCRWKRLVAPSQGEIELLRSTFARLRLQRRECRPDQPHAPAQGKRVAHQSEADLFRYRAIRERVCAGASPRDLSEIRELQLQRHRARHHSLRCHPDFVEERLQALGQHRVLARIAGECRLRADGLALTVRDGPGGVPPPSRAISKSRAESAKLNRLGWAP